MEAKGPVLLHRWGSDSTDSILSEYIVRCGTVHKVKVDLWEVSFFDYISEAYVATVPPSARQVMLEGSNRLRGLIRGLRLNLECIATHASMPWEFLLYTP